MKSPDKQLTLGTLLAIALSGPLALAQNPVLTTQTAATNLWASAMVWPTSSRKSFPQHGNITAGVVLPARVAGADATLQTKLSPSSQRVVMEHRISGRASVARGAILTVGGSTLLRYRAQTATRAVLRVTIRGTSTRAHAWTGQVDVGNNGRVDLSGSLGKTVTRDFPVVVDKNSLYVKTTQTVPSFIGTVDSFACTIVVELVPVTSVETYGKQCAQKPPRLRGFANLGGSLELVLDHAAPRAHSGRIVGTRKLSASIPGTGCWLNSDILLVLPFSTDSQGRHTTTWPIPPNVDFTIQDALAHLDGGRTTLRTTNGLRIVRR